MTLTDDEKAVIRARHTPEYVYLGPADTIGGYICPTCGDPVESEPCDVIRALDALDAQREQAETVVRQAGALRDDATDKRSQLATLTAALRDPDEATVEAVTKAINLSMWGTYEPDDDWDDEARAAIAALADHLLGGEGE